MAGKAAKKGGKDKSGSRGGISGLFRLLVMLSGLILLVWLVGGFVTRGALEGTWSPVTPELSDAALEKVADIVGNQVGTGAEAGKRETSPKPLFGKELRVGLARLGMKVAGAVTQNVKLELKGAGYRFEGDALRLQTVALLYGTVGRNASSSRDMTGCLSGTYDAVFPLVRATCGDGSGRSFFFLMKGWPSQELRLLPLPFGNDEASERIRSLTRGKGLDREQLETLNELLTLRFKR